MSEEIVQEEAEVLEEALAEAENLPEEEEVTDEATEEAEDVDYKALYEQSETARKKAEAAIIKSKRKTAPQPVSNEPEAPTSSASDERLDAMEQVTFALQNGLNADEVQALQKLNMPMEQALSSFEGQAILRATKAKSKIAANTPQGGRQGVVNRDGKSLTDVVYSRESSQKDKASAFKEARRNTTGK